MKKLSAILGLLIIVFVSACGTLGGGESAGGAVGVNQLATPTPLPTPIVPEKPQYTVQQGTVVNRVKFTGRVSPVNEAQLSFTTSGPVSAVNVSQGDEVTAGTILASLNIDAQEKEVRNAERELVNAQRNLELAEQAHVEKLLDAEIALQRFITENSQSSDQGEALLNQEKAVGQAQERVDGAARDYQYALSDPNSDQAYIDALSKALEAAEQDLLLAQKGLTRVQKSAGGSATKGKKIEQIQAENNYRKLLEGIGPETQWAVERAEGVLAEAKENLNNAQLVAPFDGRVLSVNVKRGGQAEPYKAVVVMAKLDDLELTANLDATTLAKLSIGQGATVQLLNRPGETLTGDLRTLPYPYGGGSGANSNNEEKVARISINEETELTLGELADVEIALQEKSGVLWLPPAAIRQFQGRKFVVVQTGDGQQRVDVRLGIESEDRVEILEGVEAGQTIIGE